jgi:phosphate transport system protein
MTITTVNLSSQISHPERTYFERALKRLEQDVLRMGTLVEESFRLSHQSLFENQLENIAKITVLEKQIDQFYRQIEQECSTFLTCRPPLPRT